MLDAFRTRLAHSMRQLRDLFSEPSDPASAARLQQERFAALRQNTPGMMAANIGNALALLATLIDTPLGARVAIWTDAILLVALYIYLRARRRVGRRAPPGVTRIGRRAVINALILGLLWAAVPLLFFLDASPGARLMVISLTAGMLFGGAFSLARAPLAATVFAAPIAISAAITLLRGDDPDLTRIAVVLCLYVAVLLRGVYVEATTFRDRVLSQLGAERLARTDPLTGLPNRLAFTDAVDKELARVERGGGGAALLLVDIDNFKTINDRFGHAAGDELLAQAAGRMRAALSASDLVARLGGDEFALIAPGNETDTAAAALAARIVACFEEPFLVEGRAIKGAASVGGALAPRHGTDERALFKCADVAMYQAKQQGGGARIFRPAADEGARLAVSQPHSASAAAKSTLYQPIMNLARGEIVGCKALLRWRGGAAALTEKPGRSGEICLWAAEKACAAAAGFPGRFRVCVAVAHQHLCEPGFAERMLDAVARARLEPSRLEIEIGEPSLEGREAILAELSKISGAGVTISLTGAGTGFSSLAHFCGLPLDRVRIGAPLVSDMFARKDGAAVLGAVTRIAGALGLGVTAAGVETMAQLDRLRDMGVAEAEGGLIARPMALEELEAFVADWRPERLAPEPAQKRA